MKSKWLYSLIIFSIFFLLVSSCNYDKNDGEKILENLEIDEYAAVNFNFDQDSGFYNELYQYLYESNRLFIEYLDSLEYISHKSVRHSGITYLVGETGVGKSLFSRIIKSRFGIRFLRLPMRELAGGEYSEYFNLVPELQDISGDTIMSEMLDIKFKKSLTFSDFLKFAEFGDFLSSDKIFLVVDELDELHPTSRDLILSLIEEFVQINKTLRTFRFIHVFVLGRTELFYDFFTEINNKHRVFRITPPHFRNMHDLRVLKLDYENYFDQQLPEHSLESTEKLLKKNPFLLATINNLFRSNHVIGESVAMEGMNEFQIKEALFVPGINRIHYTHNRPSIENRLYIKALENVALKKLNEVDSHGYFQLNPEETISIQHEGKSYTFRICDLLENSGLIMLDLDNLSQKRAKFHPTWVHRFLVERNLNQQGV